MTEPVIDTASAYIDDLDWVRPTELLEHLGRPLELERRPYAARTTTGHVVAVGTAFEIDVLNALLTEHGAEPPVAAPLDLRPCRPDQRIDHDIHLRTRRLFGQRTQGAQP